MSIVLTVAALFLALISIFIKAQYQTASNVEGVPVAGPGLQAVSFPEANRVYGEGQPEYKPLPAFVSPELKGEVVTCWKLSFWDRVKVAFTGRLWCSQLTFHGPLQPLYFSVNKADVLLEKEGTYIDNRYRTEAA